MTELSGGVPSAPTAGPFVSNITDLVKIEPVGSTQLVVIRIAEKPALSGVFGLWARCVLLIPSELRSPAELRCPSCSRHVSSFEWGQVLNLRIFHALAARGGPGPDREKS